MPETTFEKIVRKSGMKPISCKCNICKSQCNVPCLGTPEDMIKIVEAGFGNRLMKTVFAGVPVIMPLLDKEKKSCTFLTNGLCELHDSGLKPTVGKLSHHSTTFQNINIKKLPSALVLKEWQK